MVSIGELDKAENLLNILIKTKVYILWDKGDLELGEYLIPQRTIINCLIRTGNKLITYENASPLENGTMLSEIQVNCAQDIIVSRETINLDISTKEMIQVISDIGQTDSYVQAENHYVYLILEERLPNPNRHGRVIKY